LVFYVRQRRLSGVVVIQLNYGDLFIHTPGVVRPSYLVRNAISLLKDRKSFERKLRSGIRMRRFLFHFLHKILSLTRLVVHHHDQRWTLSFSAGEPTRTESRIRCILLVPLILKNPSLPLSSSPTLLVRTPFHPSSPIHRRLMRSTH